MRRELFHFERKTWVSVEVIKCESSSNNSESLEGRGGFSIGFGCLEKTIGFWLALHSNKCIRVALLRVMHEFGKTPCVSHF